jgi:hypothetical protein
MIDTEGDDKVLCVGGVMDGKTISVASGAISVISHNETYEFLTFGVVTDSIFKIGVPLRVLLPAGSSQGTAILRLIKGYKAGD